MENKIRNNNRPALVSALVMLALAMSAQAQDTYLNHDFAQTSDLFGSARHVGMGGATGALGADMSSMSANPAGIGLYRRSDASFTAGMVRQVDENILGLNPLHGSFDQIGIVFAYQTDVDRFVNFGFNYQKKADFHHTFLADNRNTGGASLSNAMADIMNYYGTTTDQDGYVVAPSPLSQALYDGYIINDDEEGFFGQKSGIGGNQFQSISKGSVHAFDFNVSGNYLDRVYWGVTLGVDYLRYKNESYFMEYVDVPDNPNDNYDYNVDAWKKVTGVGANLKVGVIFRPIEYSPLRVGLTLETPTYYKLKMDAGVDAYYIDHLDVDAGACDAYRDFNLRTPWRFRLSGGYTVDRWLAVGAEYEYSMYNRTKVSYSDTYYDDYYYDDYIETEKDDALNTFTNSVIKGVHGLKVGAEAQLGGGISVRAGYNYYSSAFRKGAYLQHDASLSVMDVSTTAHYMNLSDVNIMTAGLGYKHKNVYFDMAYKYRMQSGKFYAFDNTLLRPVDVNLNRHQLFFTLGCKF